MRYIYTKKNLLLLNMTNLYGEDDIKKGRKIRLEAKWDNRK